MKIKKNHILTMTIMSLLGVSQTTMAGTDVLSPTTLNGVTRTIDYATAAQQDHIASSPTALEQATLATVFANNGVDASSLIGLVTTVVVDNVPISIVSLGGGKVAIAQPQANGTTVYSTAFGVKDAFGNTLVSATKVANEYIKTVTQTGYTSTIVNATDMANSVKAGIDAPTLNGVPADPVTGKPATKGVKDYVASVCLSSSCPAGLVHADPITADPSATVANGVASYTPVPATDVSKLLQIKVLESIAQKSATDAIANTVPSATPLSLATPLPSNVTAGAVSAIAASPVVQVAAQTTAASSTKTVVTAEIAAANAAAAAPGATDAQKAAALQLGTVGGALQAQASIALVAALTDPGLAAASAAAGVTPPDATKLAAASSDVATVASQLQTATAALIASPLVSAADKTAAASAAADVAASASSSQAAAATAIAADPNASLAQIAAASQAVTAAAAQVTAANNAVTSTGGSLTPAQIQAAADAAAQAAAAQAAANAAIVNSLPNSPEQTAAVAAQSAVATAQTAANGTAQALATAKATLATTLADPTKTDAEKTAALNAVKAAAAADITAQQTLSQKQALLVTAQNTLADTLATGAAKDAVLAGATTAQAAATAATNVANADSTVGTATDAVVAAQTDFATKTAAAVQPAADLVAAKTAFTAAVAPTSTLTEAQKQTAWTTLKAAATADAASKQAVATSQQALLASYTAAGVTPTAAQTAALTAAQTAATAATAAAQPAALALANGVTIDVAGNLLFSDPKVVAAAKADRAMIASEQAKVTSALGTEAAKVAEHAAMLDAALATVEKAGKITATDTANINTAAASYVNQLAEVKTTAFQAKHNSTSGIAGNPASNMSMMIDSSFNQVADFSGTAESSKTNLASASSDIGGISTSVGVGLQYGYYNINGKSVNTVTMPLSVTAKFNPKHQLTLSVPLSYIQTQGQSDAYQVGVTAAYKYSMTDYWSLTPAVTYSYRSFDNSQNQYWNPNTSTSLVGGSITSKYTWNFNQMAVSLINMIGHYQTLDSEKNTSANLNLTNLAGLANGGNFVGNSTSNKGIASYVVKNGLHATKVYGNFKVGAYFTDTEFFGSGLYFNQLNEFGFSLKPQNMGKLDALSIDANYLFSIAGKHSSELDGFRLNLGYKF